ncbi:hypothetical protein [Actinoplanes utahensis]|uniref:Uncharacterized protein n=1 Tax=Actinoplanes utahensis TaxID=1869 RepID=A0A0A6URY1_ACTUT|nr:hypothetical protein [Actinoplanes utahensis]KHD77219.1 hypothetical protein MB27_12310 [Actinoplanes utahensis]GIF33561.1 hypothetical protein Aut01nite_65470 [Actinoplanes utahensis]
MPQPLPADVPWTAPREAADDGHAAIVGDATITVAGRAAENVPLLRRSGATSVITSSEAAGRLLGLAARSPAASDVVGDLLVQGNGLRLVDRPGRPDGATSQRMDTEKGRCRPGYARRACPAAVRVSRAR